MAIPCDQLFHTFSIVARDVDTGQLGVAVQTHQMCVGSIVPWLMPGTGALATQAHANITYGPVGLAMLGEGVPAPQVVEALVASDPGADRRQVAVVDAEGRVGAWTGEHCIPQADHYIGAGYSVQANMMGTDTVVPAMAAAYEGAVGDLAQRMTAVLHAAQREGGDIRGMQSAALKVVSGDPQAAAFGRVLYDLRVDESDDPLRDMARLVRLRHAQIVNSDGYRLLEDDPERAMATWARARALAPELEEMAFWQAIQLADVASDVETAAQILGEMLAHEKDRRTQWIDLIRRMQACGAIERAGAGEDLIAALEG
jgi:uncharacterized Ntn-hydrolase superfamily protein